MCLAQISCFKIIAWPFFPPRPHWKTENKQGAKCAKVQTVLELEFGTMIVFQCEVARTFETVASIYIRAQDLFGLFMRE